MAKAKKIGLALGGGGARGCAHIGVIKALNEAGIEVNCVAGTSIGSIVGAALASGDIELFEDYLKQLKWNDVVRFFDPTIPYQGLFKGDQASKLIGRLLTHHRFEDLKIPFTAVATNLETSEEVRINEGSILEAIRASIALPGIFIPSKHKGRYLVDGGVVNPMPINVVGDMGAEIVIGIDLNYEFIKEKLGSKSKKQLAKSRIHEWLTPERPNIIDVIESSVFIMQSQITEKNLETCQPDILIRPVLGSAGVFDFHKAKGMIQIGYECMQKELPKLLQLLKN
jgi:NTE family protein